MKKFFNYIKESKAEMQHVSWPTRHQTWIYTILVIVIAVAIAAYLGVFDFIFAKLLEAII